MVSIVSWCGAPASWSTRAGRPSFWPSYARIAATNQPLYDAGVSGLEASLAPSPTGGPTLTSSRYLSLDGRSGYSQVSCLAVSDGCRDLAGQLPSGQPGRPSPPPACPGSVLIRQEAVGGGVPRRPVGHLCVTVRRVRSAEYAYCLNAAALHGRPSMRGPPNARVGHLCVPLITSENQGWVGHPCVGASYVVDLTDGPWLLLLRSPTSPPPVERERAR